MNMRVPITQAQLGVFLASQRRKKDENYNLPFLFTLDSIIDINRLSSAVEKVVKAHPAIMNRLVMEEDGSICIEDHSGDEFRLVIEKAASGTDVLDRIQPPGEDGIRHIIPFDLLRDRLFRIRIFETPEENYLYIDFHHIIADGMSLRLFLRQLEAAYDGIVPSSESWCMTDVAAEEEELRKSNVFDDETEWYKENFAVDEFSHIPGTASGAPRVDEYEGFRKIRIPMMISEDEISEICRSTGIGKSALFQTAFAYVLSEYNYAGEAAFTTVFNGRTRDREKEVFTMMVRTLPVKISFEKGQSIPKLLKQVQELNEGTRKRKTVSLIDLNRSLGWTGEISFVYQGEYTNTELCLSGKIHCAQDLREHEPGIVFSMEVLHVGKGYEAHVSWPVSILEEKFIRDFAGQVDRVVREICRVNTVDEIELLSPEEKHAMVSASGGEKLDFDDTKTVTDFICEQSLRTPDVLAVSDTERELTYKELTDRGDILADVLIKAGVRENDFVAVMLDRSILFPVAVIGIHKAGAAYLPLDPEYPADRLNYMLSDSQVKVMLTSHTDLAGRTDTGRLKTDTVIYLDDIDFDAALTAPAINRSRPDGYAYMIYTSGSTGTPKGVILHHAGLLNQTEGLIKTLEITEDDRVGCHRSFGFDAHTADIYPVLTIGGSLHIMPSGIRKDISAIADYLKKERITLTGFTTSIGRLIIPECKGLPLRICLGGECLNGINAEDMTVYNMYGPTECTNDNIAYRLKNYQSYDTVPIGRPLPNMWGFVTDRFGHLVPDGIPGELCLAGIQAGCGYWRQPQMTEEVFLYCPFVDTDDMGHPVRMFRTGDLVYRDKDGDLVCNGRTDAQIKLRGYRIEPGEIESRVSELPFVKECVAAVVSIGKVKHLCLYYTSDEPVPPDADSIRNALQNTSLAAYMIPDIYKYLDDFPRTSSGKIDKKNLPVSGMIEKGVDIVEPRTISELKLYHVVARVLGTMEFGVTTDLCRMGMSSLDALMIAAQAQKHEVLIKAMDLLKYRSIENVLKNGKKICYWFSGKRDPLKPVLVVPYGFNSVTRFGPLIERLGECFSVIVIENLLDHYHYIFMGETINEVIGFYLEMLDYMLSEDCTVYGFFGHSFGAELAYRLAAAWADRSSSKPQAFILDPVIDKTGEKERFKNDWDNHRKALANDPAALQEAEAGLKMAGIAEILSDGIEFPSYDGRVVLFAACPDEEISAMARMHGITIKAVDPDESPNIQAWKELAPNLVAVPIKEVHDFLQDKKYADLYIEYMLDESKTYAKEN